jgi:hypothetical protein
MAQWKADTQTFDQAISRRYEVTMLANNANGDIVSFHNPLPVLLTGGNNITITGNTNIIDTVNVASSPQNPVHTHITEVGTSGNLQVSYLPIGGNVNVTSGFITLSDRSGNLFSFNNHAINTNRGWTMDDTMRPVVSIRVSDTATSITDLAEIIEYEIGNNNASQSTIIYEWYEGEIAISGAAIPAWTSLGTKCQYRVYQDKNSSNQSNTFTPNGAIMRHSGVIIGKNSSADEGPATLKGGATPNMLTLCMRRVDNATKLDVWFAFTIKELT